MPPVMPTATNSDLIHGKTGEFPDRLGRVYEWVNGRRVRRAQTPTAPRRRGVAPGIPSPRPKTPMSSPLNRDAEHRAMWADITGHAVRPINSEDPAVAQLVKIGEKAAKHWDTLEFLGPLAPAARGLRVIMNLSSTVASVAVKSVARERGLPKEHINRVSTICGVLDTIASLSHLPAVSHLPIGSMAYLMYTTARHPLHTFRAAKKGVEHVIGEMQKYQRGQPMQEVGVAKSLPASMIATLLERAHTSTDFDFWTACFLSAIDENHGNVEEAISTADSAAKAYGNGPGVRKRLYPQLLFSDMQTKSFDESKHPRGEGGKFAEAWGGNPLYDNDEWRQEWETPDGKEKLAAWAEELAECGDDPEEIQSAIKDAIAHGVNPTYSDNLTSLSEYLDLVDGWKAENAGKPEAPPELNRWTEGGMVDDGYGNAVEYHANPSDWKLLKLLNASKEGALRGLAKGNNVVVWDAEDVFHNHMKDEMGMDHDDEGDFILTKDGDRFKVEAFRNGGWVKTHPFTARAEMYGNFPGDQEESGTNGQVAWLKIRKGLTRCASPAERLRITKKMAVLIKARRAGKAMASPLQRHEGDVWQGASGRWFTLRNGRSVPTKNPNAAAKPASKPKKPKATDHVDNPTPVDPHPMPPNRPDGSFDGDAWDAREQRIAASVKASKDAGNLHLDQAEHAVEALRGKTVHSLRDGSVGVVRTVANTGDVIVNWNDEYSATRNSAVQKEEKVGRKKPVKVWQSWLAPGDQSEFVVGQPAATTKLAPSVEHDDTGESTEAAAEKIVKPWTTTQLVADLKKPVRFDFVETARTTGWATNGVYAFKLSDEERAKITAPGNGNKVLEMKAIEAVIPKDIVTTPASPDGVTATNPASKSMFVKYTDGTREAWLDAKYVAAITKRWPDAVAYIPPGKDTGSIIEKDKPVVFKRGSETIGVIVPVTGAPTLVTSDGSKPWGEDRSEEIAAARAAKRQQEEQDRAKKKADAKTAADASFRDKFDGFGADKTPLQRSRIDTALSTNLRWSGGRVLSRRDLIREKIAAGWKIGSYPGEGRTITAADGTFLSEKQLTKTAIDYAEHLLARKADGHVITGSVGATSAAAVEGPKEGDIDAAGLVFRDGRWHRDDGQAKEPWQMTRAEFRDAQNRPLLEAAQEAMRRGEPIYIRTQTKIWKYTNPDMMKIDSEGFVRIQNGKRWDVIAGENVDDIGAQAGIPQVPWDKKRYHSAEVKEAVAAGKPVPANVLAEYPDLDTPIGVGGTIEEAKADATAIISRATETPKRKEDINPHPYTGYAHTTVGGFASVSAGGATPEEAEAKARAELARQRPDLAQARVERQPDGSIQLKPVNLPDPSPTGKEVGYRPEFGDKVITPDGKVGIMEKFGSGDTMVHVRLGRSNKIAVRRDSLILADDSDAAKGRAGVTVESVVTRGKVIPGQPVQMPTVEVTAKTPVGEIVGTGDTQAAAEQDLRDQIVSAEKQDPAAREQAKRDAAAVQVRENWKYATPMGVEAVLKQGGFVPAETLTRFPDLARKYERGQFATPNDRWDTEPGFPGAARTRIYANNLGLMHTGDPADIEGLRAAIKQHLETFAPIESGPPAPKVTESKYDYPVGHVNQTKRNIQIAPNKRGNEYFVTFADNRFPQTVAAKTREEAIEKARRQRASDAGVKVVPQDDGPTDGDRNAEGLVFHNGRWHREEDLTPTEKPGYVGTDLTDSDVDFIEEMGPQGEPDAAPANPAESDDAIDAEEQREADNEAWRQKNPHLALANVLAERLRDGDTLTAKEVFAAADAAHGGTRADGKYGPSDAYDSLEAGMNMALAGTTDPRVDLEEAKRTAEALDARVNQLPTQTNRSGNKDAFQQFSTPPHYAYAAAWLANIRPGDIALEPTGGTGSLAIHAKNGDAEVYGNELDPRRADFLKQILGDDHVTVADAEQISAILPGKGVPAPSVVIMNPPFSATAGRMGDKKVPMTAANHIKEALNLLQPGGRLVAIVGRGMSPDAATFKKWFAEIQKKYALKANVGVSGDVYKKYGTHFGTRVLVIDKVSPTVNNEAVTGDVETIPALLEKLSEVRDDRPNLVGQPPVLGTGSGDAGPAAGTAGLASDATRPVVDDVVLPPTKRRGRRRPEVPGTPPDAATAGSSGEDAGGGLRPAPDGSGGSAGSGEVAGPVGGARRTRGRTPKREDVSGGGANPRGEPEGQPVAPVSGLRPATPVSFVRNPHLKYDEKGVPFTGVITDAAGRKQTYVDGRHVANAEDTAKESLYETYHPSKVHIEGAQEHKFPLVESAAMSAVAAPDPHYNPTLSPDLIERGDLSEAQLEAIVYAGQAHEQWLPTSEGDVRDDRAFTAPDGKTVHVLKNFGGYYRLVPEKRGGEAIDLSFVSLEDAEKFLIGNGWKTGEGMQLRIGGEAYRKGYFIGDGTGVGKGREVAGTMLDNWNQGRRKHVWVSQKWPLLDDAKRDWAGLGQDPESVFKFKDLTKKNVPEDGICFVTYDTLKNGKGKAKSNIDKLVDWLGPDFDGVVSFDEAHVMANAQVSKGARGMRNASQVALSGIELQKRLPKARVIYASATGATEVSNLAYADRLGIWGRGTSFPEKADFIAKMGTQGITGMEMIAQSMKAQGMYGARSLSFGSDLPEGDPQKVAYDRVKHHLSEDQKAQYDAAAEGWQSVLENIDKALELCGAGDSAKAKSNASSQFWGSQIRFFDQVLTSMQTPSVIARIREDLENGRSAVVQLVGTGEAATERAIDKRAVENEGVDEDELPDLDISPKLILQDYLEHSFPTQRHEEYEDSEGHTKTRPVETYSAPSDGLQVGSRKYGPGQSLTRSEYESLKTEDQKKVNKHPVHDPEAVALRDELMAKIGDLRIPAGPIDQIINAFGPEAVAEVTGRSVRLINGKPEDRKSSAANIEEPRAFQDGRKKILVFSGAGGTGRSYHADRNAKNQEKRMHYLLQPGWRADAAMQGFGRTHRTNQKQAPQLHLVQIEEVPSQKRFISTIARRLDQLGALTRGQAQTGGGGLFTASDNLESPQAHDAMKQMFHDLRHGGIEGLDHEEVIKQMGLKKKETGIQKPEDDEDPKKVTQMLNRMLSLKLGMQHKVMDSFTHRLDKAIAQAIASGKIDQGTSHFKALKTTPKSETVIFRDPASGAEAKHLIASATTASHRRPWSANVEGYEKPIKFIKNSQSGKVWAVYKGVDETLESGDVVRNYLLRGPGSDKTEATSTIDYGYGSNWQTITAEQAKPLWETQHAEIPPTTEHDVHFVSGATLPVWDKLPGSKPKIYRVNLADGRQIVGRKIENADLDMFHKNFPAAVGKAAGHSSSAVHANLIAGEATEARLQNGWRIKPVRAEGERRIELVGPERSHHNELIADGVIKTRISHEDRLFIPNGPEGARVIDRITAARPIVEVKAKVSKNLSASTLDDSAGGFLTQGGRCCPKCKGKLAGDFCTKCKKRWVNGKSLGRDYVDSFLNGQPANDPPVETNSSFVDDAPQAVCPYCLSDRTKGARRFEMGEGEPGDVNPPWNAECLDCGGGFDYDIATGESARWSKPEPETTSDGSADNCPVCGERYTMSCRCRIGNRSCDNGHSWHRCPEHGKINLGSGHGRGFGCTCGHDFVDEAPGTQTKKLTKCDLDAAIRDIDQEPTTAMKECGNYAKGHVTWQGLPITIENGAGHTRSGQSKAGKKWSVTMANHYGYLKRSESEADGDHVDVFLADEGQPGTDLDSQIVFIVNQNKPDGSFDEHKCMLGFTNAKAAKAAYLANYSSNWTGFRSIHPMTLDHFKVWIHEGDTSKPVTEETTNVETKQKRLDGFGLRSPLARV